MQRHRSIGVTALVALMAAHRAAQRHGRTEPSRVLQDAYDEIHTYLEAVDIGTADPERRGGGEGSRLYGASLTQP